jgi:hypothetical protein
MGFNIYCALRKDRPGRVRRFIDFAVERPKDSQAFHLPPPGDREPAPSSVRRQRAPGASRPEGRHRRVACPGTSAARAK